MGWATDDLTNTQLDGGTDDPSLARAQLNALLLKVQAILAEVTPGNTLPEKEAANIFTALQSLDAGFDIQPAGETMNLTVRRPASGKFWIAYNDDGTNTQLDVTKPSYLIQIHTDDFGCFVKAAGGSSYTQIFKGVPTSKLLDLQASDILYDGSSLKTSTRGALVKLSTSQSVPAASIAPIAFDTTVYDTDNIHDDVVNNTRLTVPPGVTKIRLSCNFYYFGTGTGAGAQLITTKNNLLFDGDIFIRFEDLPHSQQGSSAILNVVGGDYFEATVTNFETGNPGSIVGKSSAGLNTWFAMEIIE